MKQPFDNTLPPKIPVWSWCAVAGLLAPVLIGGLRWDKRPLVQVYLNPETVAFFWGLAPWLAAAAAVVTFVLKLRADGQRRAQSAAQVQSAEAMLRPVLGYALAAAAVAWLAVAIAMPLILIAFGRPGAEHTVQVSTGRLVGAISYRNCFYPIVLESPSQYFLGVLQNICPPTRELGTQLAILSAKQPTTPLVLRGWGNRFGVFFVSAHLP